MAAGQGVENSEARTIEAKGIDHPVSVFQISGMYDPGNLASA